VGKYTTGRPRHTLDLDELGKRLDVIMGTKELPVWGATLAWLAFFSFLALLFVLRRHVLSRRPRDDAASSPK
jgi:hypothetical protein